jgi:osmotically-inducible protein OsmY
MQRHKTDSEIKEQVLRELKWDSRIGWSEIGVAVQDGVVTLTGSVPSLSKKIAAQHAAHRINGVLDVANEIELQPPEIPARNDAEIAHAVRHALQWDALLPEERIRTTVADNWVTLEGEVNLWRERQEAEEVVLRLEGVLGVTNRIRVTPPPADPKELREQIEYALERRADREAERLRVEVNEGVVDLWGRVHSWQEKRAVIGSISHAPGVREVREHLRIDPYF